MQTLSLTYLICCSDFNFGIPILPYVAGRELAGTVIKAPATANTRIKEGDVVTVPSTDYRDLRKAAYQHYCIASYYNAIRIPQGVTTQSASIIGVAFVSASLALGICMGLSFEEVEKGPDLLKTVRGIGNAVPTALSSDIGDECLKGISRVERAKRGDFLVIWGGSSTCAFIVKQIARLFGLRVISVMDSAKHGLRLSTRDVIRADLMVDSHDTERAVEVIRQASNNRARFGFDTQGKDSAAHLLRCLAKPDKVTKSLAKDTKLLQRDGAKLPTPPSTPHERIIDRRKSHLVGLTGMPVNDDTTNVVLHSVPIKLFHEVPAVGEALSAWCERLLLKGLLIPPDVIGVVNGLEGINEGLDRMRRREISGGRLVANLA